MRFPVVAFTRARPPPCPMPPLPSTPDSPIIFRDVLSRPSPLPATIATIVNSSVLQRAPGTSKMTGRVPTNTASSTHLGRHLESQRATQAGDDCLSMDSAPLRHCLEVE